VNILSLNTEAFGGGASRIALSLLNFYNAAGHPSKLYNAIHDVPGQQIQKLRNDQSRNVFQRILHMGMKASLDKGIPLLPKIFQQLMCLAEPIRHLHIRQGHDDFWQPATSRIPGGIDPPPVIIHAHNLFGGFFDLRQLPRISGWLPFVWTLHDMWAFTGHCSHPLDCRRWLESCGKCPYPSLPPAVTKDGTAFNLAQKRAVYEKSRVYLATPSQWLMDRAQSSVLAPGVVSARVIPNGVDQSSYKPASKSAAREALGIPQGASVLLFVAAGNRSNPWKDYDTLDGAAQILARRLHPGKLVLMVPGADHPSVNLLGVEVKPVPWTDDPASLATYYQAADLYLHAAHAENFPNVILEALSCGLPVVGTDVGGIPEQIQDGVNGFVVPKSDPQAMADRAIELLSDKSKLNLFSESAASSARGKYSLERMGNEYLDWFHELLEAA
jgi:glycosyltransferase involved in cell wall biosynthesis